MRLPELRTWPFRYELIDGLRGLAALVVVMSHSGWEGAGRYAVMAFFVISGYCIAASAETCRRNNASFRGFMWRRLHRIYPPYFFAIVFFVFTRVVKIATGGPNDLNRPVLDWIQNLTMTQWVSLLFHPVAEAAQNPKLLVAAFWSLNYEDQFYLVMAVALLFAVRRGIQISTVVLCLAAVSLAWVWAWPGPWVTGFFIEYWLHFALGAMLFYVLCLTGDARLRAAYTATLVLLGAWCLCHVLPWDSAAVLDRRAYVEVGMACVFALGLLVLRPVSAAVSRYRLWRPVAALGTISYSLYLVHQFNLNIVASVVNRFIPGAGMAGMVALQLLIAAVFWYLCERPFTTRRDSSQGDRTPRSLTTVGCQPRPSAPH